MNSFFKRILPLALSSLFYISCAYQPEDPGQCKLTCSSAIIGSNDLQMQFQWKTVKSAVSCATDAAGQSIDGMRASFLLTENILDQEGNKVAERPVPNISIEPVMVGLLASIDNNEADPAYKGVRTPRANWCTDACGVVTIDFVPVCPPAGMKNEVTVQVHSGALFSEPATFPIETVAPTTE